MKLIVRFLAQLLNEQLKCRNMNGMQEGAKQYSKQSSKKHTVKLNRVLIRIFRFTETGVKHEEQIKLVI